MFKKTLIIFMILTSKSGWVEGLRRYFAINIRADYNEYSVGLRWRSMRALCSTSTTPPPHTKPCSALPSRKLSSKTIIVTVLSVIGNRCRITGALCAAYARTATYPPRTMFSTRLERSQKRRTCGETLRSSKSQLWECETTYIETTHIGDSLYDSTQRKLVSYLWQGNYLIYIPIFNQGVPQKHISMETGWKSYKERVNHRF